MGDISHPERLQKQVEYLEANPEVDVSATHIKIFGTETNRTLDIFPQEKGADFPQEILDCLARANCIAHPTVVIKKEILQKYRYHMMAK